MHNIVSLDCGVTVLILRFEKSDIVWCGLSKAPPSLPHLLCSMKAIRDDGNPASVPLFKTSGSTVIAEGMARRLAASLPSPRAIFLCSALPGGDVELTRRVESELKLLLAKS